MIINYTYQGTSSCWISNIDVPTNCQIPYYIHYGNACINEPLNSSKVYHATFNRWAEENGKIVPSFRISNKIHKIPIDIKIELFC